MIDTHPQWFKEALSVSKEQKSIRVEGGTHFLSEMG